MNRWSNEELISAFQHGKEEMLKAWYDHEKPTFISMGRKIGLKQINDILDIYQEAMAILYVKIKDGSLTDLKAPLHSYLLSIGKYKSIDFMKRQGLTMGDRIDPEEMELAQSVREEGTGVDEERRQSVKLAILNLGKKCREVILLFYYEGLTISEIRDYMGYKDANTVKSHKSRCVKSLKEKIRIYG